MQNGYKFFTREEAAKVESGNRRKLLSRLVVRLTSDPSPKTERKD